MNFLSVNSSSLSPAPWDAGLTGMDSSQSLARLNGAACCGPTAAQGFTQQIRQFEMQLLQMLVLLMVGSPLPATGEPAPLPSPQSGPSGPVQRIPGGTSNYTHGMFHKGDKGAPNSYAFENSPAGIKFAADHGFSSIDLDMQITKDGIPVNTHWSQPMLKDGFYDPENKLDPKTKVSEMTLSEVSRLRNKDGQSMIHTVASQIGELKKNAIAGDFEAKDDPRFATPQIMGEIAALVRNAGVHANMKSIDRGPRSMQILRAAQAQGFYVRFAHAGSKPGRAIGYGL